MDVFQVFKTVQMVQNRVTRLIFTMEYDGTKSR